MTEKLTDKNRTRPRLLEGLHLLALLRYSTPEILRTVKKTALKLHILSKPSLASLQALVDPDPYRLTARGFSYLRDNGYTLPYQERLQGGGAHDLQVAAKVLQEYYTPDFYHALYPDFSYIRPDCLFIHRRPGEYRLTFLEVEISPKTDEYLGNKRRNYERLSQDYELWNGWWREQSKHLRLPFCTIDQFCFSVRWE